MAGSRGIEPRWPVLETSAIPDRLLHDGVSARFRSGTFAVTARRAGHYTTDTIGSGWLELPQRPPVPETGAHPTELHPETRGAQAGLPPEPLRGRCGTLPRFHTQTRGAQAGLPAGAPSREVWNPPRVPQSIGAPVWNRTSTSWTSARRHHQIGYGSISLIGLASDQAHPRLFDCQRPANELVRGRGVEPRRAGSKPAGLPLADPRALGFSDEAWRCPVRAAARAPRHHDPDPGNEKGRRGFPGRPFVERRIRSRFSRPSTPSARNPGTVAWGYSSLHRASRRDHSSTRTRPESQTRPASNSELCGEWSARLCEGELGCSIRQGDFSSLLNFAQRLLTQQSPGHRFHSPSTTRTSGRGGPGTSVGDRRRW
jgi:hypothetical protein